MAMGGTPGSLMPSGVRLQVNGRFTDVQAAGKARLCGLGTKVPRETVTTVLRWIGKDGITTQDIKTAIGAQITNLRETLGNGKMIKALSDLATKMDRATEGDSLRAGVTGGGDIVPMSFNPLYGSGVAPKVPPRSSLAAGADSPDASSGAGPGWDPSLYDTGGPSRPTVPQAWPEVAVPYATTPAPHAGAGSATGYETPVSASTESVSDKRSEGPYAVPDGEKLRQYPKSEAPRAGSSGASSGAGPYHTTPVTDSAGQATPEAHSPDTGIYDVPNRETLRRTYGQPGGTRAGSPGATPYSTLGSHQTYVGTAKVRSPQEAGTGDYSTLGPGHKTYATPEPAIPPRPASPKPVPENKNGFIGRVKDLPDKILDSDLASIKPEEEVLCRKSHDEKSLVMEYMSKSGEKKKIGVPLAHLDTYKYKNGDPKDAVAHIFKVHEFGGEESKPQPIPGTLREVITNIVTAYIQAPVQPPDTDA